VILFGDCSGDKEESVLEVYRLLPTWYISANVKMASRRSILLILADFHNKEQISDMSEFSAIAKAKVAGSFDFRTSLCIGERSSTIVCILSLFNEVRLIIDALGFTCT
jgi:hypothetical protein